MEDTQHPVSRRTWLNRESLYRNRTNAHSVGTKKPKLVTPDDVSVFYKDTAKTPESSTVTLSPYILNKTFGAALKRKELLSNPVLEASKPKIPRRDKEVLTADQVRKLLETRKGGRFEGVFVLGAWIGEVLGSSPSFVTHQVAPRDHGGCRRLLTSFS